MIELCAVGAEQRDLDKPQALRSRELTGPAGWWLVPQEDMEDLQERSGATMLLAARRHQAGQGTGSQVPCHLLASAGQSRCVWRESRAQFSSAI